MPIKNSKKSEKKVVLTGGHAATTALATIEALKKEGAWDISWIGSARAIEGKSALTLEFREFPKLGIKCYGIITGRVQRRFTRYSILSLAKIPFGFLHALYLLLRIRPRIVLSFGGFAAFPIVVCAFILRIPVVLHEQTIAIGLANKFSIPFANKIALSRKESQAFFPRKKSILIGNPVRSEFFKVKKREKIGNPPIILATGGSRGSQVFNKYLLEALPALLPKYIVIHQSGDLGYEACLKLKESLPKDKKSRYELFASIPVGQMHKFFERADIIVGRAGANTVAEVIASKRPAIFMPIPWSQNDEQAKNAFLAKSAGQAEIIDQNTASGEVFLNTINKVAKNWKKMIGSNNDYIYNLDKNAAYNLAKLLKEMLA